MTNYDLSLTKCMCVRCGKTFGCIRAVWFCKECSEKVRQPIIRREENRLTFSRMEDVIDAAD